jgi:hypothetical protein
VDRAQIRRILEDVQNNRTAPEEALAMLERLDSDLLGYATVDHHRALRVGFPEVIFGQGKTPDQIVGIFESLSARQDRVLITRVDAEKAALITQRVPVLDHNPLARTLAWVRSGIEIRGRGTILIVAAGTSDLPVAEEAAVTARILGNRTDMLSDVGVAGIHRLLANSSKLREAAVVIAVAGMEGALPSVIGGLVARPVIAVPTSVGYGAAFGGIAALLGMLNSCASGVVVVNIDNGFGAAYAATLINAQDEDR